MISIPILLFVSVCLSGCYSNPPWSAKARLEAMSSAQASQPPNEWFKTESHRGNLYDSFIPSTGHSNPGIINPIPSSILSASFRVNSSLTIPLVPVSRSCEGMQLGMYIWEQFHWQTSDLGFATHLSRPNAQRWTCGDVLVNVADYSNADYIKDSAMLLPFMINVRRAGNRGVIWLTYGDVVEKDHAACKTFARTFFDWLATVPDEWIDVIKPVGISYDIENFPSNVLVDVLTDAQRQKNAFIHKYGADGILVQSTIENHEKQHETDIVMKLADRALMMAYRNHLSNNDGLLQRMHWMFTHQCKHCLNDDYAIQHYKAKITVLLETACKLGKSCSYISFCAYDGKGYDGGIEFLGRTLSELGKRLISDGVMTEAQRKRLFSPTAPFAVHDWDWFRCFYQDTSDSHSRCASYHTYAATCRKS